MSRLRDFSSHVGWSSERWTVVITVPHRCTVDQAFDAGCDWRSDDYALRLKYLLERRCRLQSRSHPLIDTVVIEV